MPVLEAGGAVLLPFSREYTAKRPVLVIAGLHNAASEISVQTCVRERVLANCSALLEWARAHAFPIAFARYATLMQMPAERFYPAWFAGFEPTRDDMVFDVFGPSFYGNLEFTSMISYSGGRFALAGLFAGLGCLAAIMEAQQRSQHVTLISDAFACVPAPGISGDSLDRAAAAQLAANGTVITAAQWMARVARSYESVTPHVGASV